MKLTEAQQVIREVQGKGYGWLKAWGISTIREAVYTIHNRKAASDADKEIAESIEIKLSRGW